MRRGGSRDRLLLGGCGAIAVGVGVTRRVVREAAGTATIMTAASPTRVLNVALNSIKTGTITKRTYEQSQSRLTVVEESTTNNGFGLLGLLALAGQCRGRNSAPFRPSVS